MTATNLTKVNEEKLRLAKERLGERYVLHPDYKPQPNHSTKCLKSWLLASVKLKAIQEGRLTA